MIVGRVSTLGLIQSSDKKVSGFVNFLVFPSGFVADKDPEDFSVFFLGGIWKFIIYSIIDIDNR